MSPSGDDAQHGSLRVHRVRLADARLQQEWRAERRAEDVKGKRSEECGACDDYEEHAAIMHGRGARRRQARCGGWPGAVRSSALEETPTVAKAGRSLGGFVWMWVAVAVCARPSGSREMWDYARPTQTKQRSET